MILRMESLRIGDVEEFPFLEPPGARRSPTATSCSRSSARSMRASELTQHRLAAREIAARSAHRPHRARRAAREMPARGARHRSALSMQDPRERPFDRAEAADQAQEQFQEEQSDFMAYLKLWRFYDEALKHRKSNRKLTELLHEHFLSHRRLREWRDIHGQLAALVGELGMQHGETRSRRRAIVGSAADPNREPGASASDVQVETPWYDRAQGQGEPGASGTPRSDV